MTAMHVLRLNRHAETLIVEADPLCWDTLQCRTRQKGEGRISSPEYSKEKCPFELYVNLFSIYICSPPEVVKFFSNISRKP